MSDEYISALKKRLKEIMDEIGYNKEQVQQLLEVIRTQEEQADYILKLLDAEGVTLGDGEVDNTLSMSVSDMAYEVLSRQTIRKPMHYRDLAELIMAQGKYIPGQDPAANLISHLTRDDRFVRTGRGIYGLAEWGLEPVTPRRRKKKRR